MTGTRSSQMKIYLTAVLGFALTSALIIFPKEAFAASLEGLKLWFEVVMPALLPFLIMAKLLMSLGVVNFIGALLEPIMQPIFRIPGTGAFAVAIGLASGYPIGAKSQQISGEANSAPKLKLNGCSVLQTPQVRCLLPAQSVSVCSVCRN